MTAIEIAKDRRSVAWVPAAGLFIAALLLYAPVRHFEFIRYDDPNYVLLHPRVSQGLSFDNVGFALTAFEVGNWHPLTLISHMIDVSLFGMRAGAHHAVNAALHAVNAALLFLFLDRATRRRVPSFVAAALFAVHPLNVESVAWISQRKSVLSMLFMLLTMMAYVAWVRHGGRLRYGLALAAAVGALASKPIALVVPGLLLLLDVWPLARPGKVVARLVEKVPFVAVTAAAAFVTFAAQRADGALGTMADFPLASRLANTTFSYAWYLLRMIWPSDLSLFYPTTLGAEAGVKVAAAAAVLVVVTGVVWRFARSNPYLAFGWAWYVVALVPVSGLVQFGTQIVADRYAYLALIGPFVAVSFLGADFFEGRSAPARRAAAGLALAVIVVSAFWSRAALPSWRDSLSILGRGYERAPGNVHALTNLGLELVEQERFDEGSALLRKAAEAVPLYSTVHVNLGYAYAKTGKLEAARAEYELAMPLRPNDAKLAFELGRVLTQLQRPREAEARFLEAVQFDPDYGKAWLFLGTVLHTEGRFAEALEPIERAVALMPGDAKPVTVLGLNLAGLGRRDDAIVALERAVALDPDYERARTELDRLRQELPPHGLR